MTHATATEIATLIDMVSRELILELKRPVRIAVSGAQGCGKTTACKAFAAGNARVAHFSLDDVYLATADRKTLAAKAHPLFKTRGPPGTHDLELAKRTLVKLKDARAQDMTPLPRFDKLEDHRVPAAHWPVFKGTANVVLVDGWCMGATAEPADALEMPVNDLELDEDDAAVWRSYANAHLEGPYADFFGRFDLFIHIQAPSFDIVPRWRLEQEATIRNTTLEKLPADVRANIARFVQFYERITRHMLAGGRRADWVVRLGEDREILGIDGPL
jgi:D-glycerate 3-kinase